MAEVERSSVPKGPQPIAVSAPGKVILHGEHAVVYGKTALAAAVNLRMYLVIYPNDKLDVFSVEMTSMDLVRAWSREELKVLASMVPDAAIPGPPSVQFLKTLEEKHNLCLANASPSTLASVAFLHLVTSLLKPYLKSSCPGLKFILVSTLPVSAGLGSSATFAVTLAAGIHILRDRLAAKSTSSLSPAPSLSPFEPSGQADFISNTGKLQPDQMKKSVDSDLDDPVCMRSSDANRSSTTNAGVSSKPVETAEEKKSCVREQDNGLKFPDSVVQRLMTCGFARPAVFEGLHGLSDVDRIVKESINSWAYQCECLIHGTPSGIDNTTSCFGGVISFTAGTTTYLDRLPPLRILLTHTKVPRSTKAMVSEVRRRKEKFPQVVEPILESIQSISQSCEQTLRELASSNLDSETATYLGELFEINHQLLNSLGVGHPTFDIICKATKECGFFSKLTGAGGGGCAVTLVTPGPDEETRYDQCLAHLRELGFDAWETELGCQGVVIHNLC